MTTQLLHEEGSTFDIAITDFRTVAASEVLFLVRLWWG